MYFFMGFFGPVCWKIYFSFASPAEPGPGCWKNHCSFAGLLRPVKNHFLFADLDPCRSLHFRPLSKREQTEKIHSKIIFSNSVNSNQRKSFFLSLILF